MRRAGFVIGAFGGLLLVGGLMEVVGIDDTKYTDPDDLSAGEGLLVVPFGVVLLAAGIALNRWARRREPSREQQSAPQFAAGWYADPEDASSWRYWDGSAWTQHKAEATTPQRASPR
jgi:hypothetical protein